MTVVWKADIKTPAVHHLLPKIQHSFSNIFTPQTCQISSLDDCTPGTTYYCIFLDLSVEKLFTWYNTLHYDSKSFIYIWTFKIALELNVPGKNLLKRLPAGPCTSCRESLSWSCYLSVVSNADRPWLQPAARLYGECAIYRREKTLSVAVTSIRLV